MTLDPKGLAVAVAIGAASGCALAFPDYTLRDGGPSSTGGSSSASSSGTGGAPCSPSTSSSSSGAQFIPFSSTVGTFDVSSAGVVVAIVDSPSPGSPFSVTCSFPGGMHTEIPGDPTWVVGDAVSSVDVAIAGDASLVAVTYGYVSAGVTYAYAYFLDGRCNKLAGPTSIATPHTTASPGVVRVSPRGDYAAVLYDAPSDGVLRLATFTRSASTISPRPVVPLPALRCLSGKGHALGMNPSACATEALIGCADAAGHIWVQTLDLGTMKLGTPVDTMLSVPSALASPTYLVEYDALGNYAVLGATASGWGLDFGSSAGPTITMPPADSISTSSLSNDRILTLPGGDFLLPIINTKQQSDFQRIDGKTGAFVHGVNLGGTIFRVDGNGSVYTRASMSSDAGTVPGISVQPETW